MPEHPAESLRGNPSLAIAEPAGVAPGRQRRRTRRDQPRDGYPAPGSHPRPPGAPASGEHRSLLAVARAPSRRGRRLERAAPRGRGFVDRDELDAPVRGQQDVRAQPSSTTPQTTRPPDEGAGRGGCFMVEGGFEQIGTFGETRASWLAERCAPLKDALASVRADRLPADMAYLFAVLVGSAIVMWTGSRAGRTHKAATPRFTRPIPLAAAGGRRGARGGHRRGAHAAASRDARAEERARGRALRRAGDRRAEYPGHEELRRDARRTQAGSPPRCSLHLRALLLRMAERRDDDALAALGRYHGPRA